MGNVPEHGPVLLVANHSGGNVTPDTLLFTLAFYTYFGVERAFYQLAHNLVLASPVGQILRRYGTVPASPENAQRALDADAALLVYPGGDWEVHRPIWERNKVDFAGRKGFVRLALDAGVPIVPVVSIGGQETALFLSHGGRLARALRVDRTLRLKVIPISLALPWGINVGDLLGHIPLPAKITVEVLAPIDVRAQFGDEPDVDEVYDHVTTLMQETLETLAAERRLSGDRHEERRIGADEAERVDRHLGPAEARLGLPGGALELPALHVGDHALGGGGRAADGSRRPLPDADQGGLGGGRRTDRDRRVAGAARHGVELGARGRPAGALAPTRARRRPHPGGAALRLRRRRLRDPRLDRRAGLGAPAGRPPATLAAPAQEPGRARAAARRGGPAQGERAARRVSASARR